MNEREFKDRTRRFALRVITLATSLPKGMLSDVIGRQLLRSGTSVGANYRAACRGRSTADVVNKPGVVEEEADESLFWMELLVDAQIVSSKRLAALMTEANEITAMVVASIKTLKRRNTRNPKSKIQNPKYEL